MRPFSPRIKFDKIYVNILAALQANGRISNLNLADEVALSASPCLERTKKLEKAGIIKRYITEVDLSKTCPHVTIWAFISLSSFPKDYRRMDRMIEVTEEIVESYKITGSFDYLVKFVCADMDSYYHLVDETLDQDLGIANLTTAVVIQRNKEFTGYPLRSLIHV